MLTPNQKVNALSPEHGPQGNMSLVNSEAMPVLYIYNLYYNGQKELGPISSWEVTWKSSVESYFQRDIHFFNPDVYGPDSSLKSDAALMDLVKNVSPRLIVMIYNNGSNWSRDFISIKTLSELQALSKILCIWGDINGQPQRSLLKKVSPYVDLNLCTASSAAANRLGMGTKVQYIPVPVLDSTIEDFCDCGCQVSFAGQIKGKRKEVIDFLKKKGVPIHLGGGQGSTTISRTQFSSILGHQMTISFSGSKLESLTNARTFEALTQKALLLEQWGSETCKLLEPYTEYVPWFNKRDCLRKIKYYQRNPTEAKQISAQGNAKLKEFSNEVMWNSVLARLMRNSEHANETPLEMNFNKIPVFYRFEARLFNFFASKSSFEILFVVWFRGKEKFRLFKFYLKWAISKARRVIFS